MNQFWRDFSFETLQNQSVHSNLWFIADWVSKHCSEMKVEGIYNENLEFVPRLNPSYSEIKQSPKEKYREFLKSRENYKIENGLGLVRLSHGGYTFGLIVFSITPKIPNSEWFTTIGDAGQIALDRDLRRREISSFRSAVSQVVAPVNQTLEKKALEAACSFMGYGKGLLYCPDKLGNYLHIVESYNISKSLIQEFCYPMHEPSLATYCFKSNALFFDRFAERSSVLANRGRTIFKINGPIVGIPITANHRQKRSIMGVIVMWEPLHFHPEFNLKSLDDFSVFLGGVFSESNTESESKNKAGLANKIGEMVILESGAINKNMRFSIKYPRIR